MLGQGSGKSQMLVFPRARSIDLLCMAQTAITGLMVGYEPAGALYFDSRCDRAISGYFSEAQGAP